MKLHYFLTSRYSQKEVSCSLYTFSVTKAGGAPFLKQSRSESLGSTSFTLRQSSCSGNVGGQPTDDEVETNRNVRVPLLQAKTSKTRRNQIPWTAGMVTEGSTWWTIAELSLYLWAPCCRYCLCYPSRPCWSLFTYIGLTATGERTYERIQSYHLNWWVVNVGNFASFFILKNI